MINKHLDQITKDDIDALITNEVREGRTLDYKATIWGGTNDERKECYADVSSFANAAGGDLVIGIEERSGSDGKPTGIPEKATGVAVRNLDAELLRLENGIRDSIEPRINGIRFRSIEGFPEGQVIIIRIPQSYNAPHMVTFNNYSRFYTRGSNGKHQLDVTEIRAAFAVSEALPQRIRNFRAERLARIVADETPVLMSEGPRLILHLVPVSAMSSASANLPDLGTLNLVDFMPLYDQGVFHRWNLDGRVTYSRDPRDERLASSYCQLFRDGIIEAVNTSLLDGGERNGARLIPSLLLEEQLIIGIRHYLDFLNNKAYIAPPIYLMLSLHGVKDHWMAVPPGTQSFSIEPRGFDRAVLLFPELLVEDLAADVKTVLHPVLDALWQSAGFQADIYYDEAGRWIGQERWR